MGISIVHVLADSDRSNLHRDLNDECPCTLLERPNLRNKEQTARWMVHSIDWGVLSTISTRFQDQPGVLPFGNIYSFVDGPCDNATGIPYIYGTYMDQSFQDSRSNAAVSLTLSEASMASVCGGYNLASCKIHDYGDPENPVCARLTLTGQLMVLEEDSDEYGLAQQALFQRHFSMKDWPHNHNWVVAKIEVQDIWLIDYFGGASNLDVHQYFSVELTPTTETQD
jgi:Pyridoxamine 5'-phosphate oxidase